MKGKTAKEAKKRAIKALEKYIDEGYELPGYQSEKSFIRLADIAQAEVHGKENKRLKEFHRGYRS